MLGDAGKLADMLGDRFDFTPVEPTNYFRDWQCIEGENRRKCNTEPPEIETARLTGALTLGFLGRSSITEVLCTSTLPRKLTQCYGIKVHAVRHRSTYALLANNRWLAGYRNEDPIDLNRCLVGGGHVMQRLEQYFHLPVDPIPKPEVYLSAEELRWAWSIRSMLPRRKSVVLISIGTISSETSGQPPDIDWQASIDAVSKWCTPVQLALTRREAYEQVAVLPGGLRQRSRDVGVSHRAARRLQGCSEKRQGSGSLESLPRPPHAERAQRR